MRTLNIELSGNATAMTKIRTSNIQMINVNSTRLLHFKKTLHLKVTPKNHKNISKSHENLNINSLPYYLKVEH